MKRREFLFGGAAAALLRGQDVPTRQAKVVKLFKSPDGLPNGLEAAPEGIWIGEQTVLLRRRHRSRRQRHR